MYLRLVEIEIYLWLESIGDTTEFQFAFRGKITWNYIFQASNCRRIILIFQYSLVETRARMVSKKLVLALEKMIYTVHASQAIFNSRTIYFLVPLHFLNFFYVKTASEDFMIFEKQPV